MVCSRVKCAFTFTSVCWLLPTVYLTETSQSLTYLSRALAIGPEATVVEMACVCCELGYHAILIGIANSLLYGLDSYKDTTQFLKPRSPYVCVSVCVCVCVCVCECMGVHEYVCV